MERTEDIIKRVSQAVSDELMGMGVVRAYVESLKRRKWIWILEAVGDELSRH